MSRHWIAYDSETGIIYGLGNSRVAARLDAAGWIDVTADPTSLKVTHCDSELARELKTRGGGEVVWTINNGIARLDCQVGEYEEVEP